MSVYLKSEWASHGWGFTIRSSLHNSDSLYCTGVGLVQGYFQDDDNPGATTGLSFLLFMPFIKGVQDLIDQSSGASAPGVRWAGA
jgi:hypothetical protein